MNPMGVSEPMGRIKRPASHKWAILVFCAVAGANIWLNTKGAFDFLGIVVTVAAVCALFVSFFMARSKRSYFVNSAALFLVLLRGAQSLCYQIIWDADQGIMGWARILCVSWLAFLMFTLLRAYVFGDASRRYYGLPGKRVDLPGETNRGA